MKFPKTVLIIDDEPEIRLIIKESLAGIAERFFECANGKEGLELLGKSKIHTVIVDYKMPVMDGFSFIKQVRAKRIDVPCIMVTGNAHTDQELKTNAILWGVLELLEKPIDFPHLIHLTTKAIELGERISNADAELEKLCEKNKIPQADRSAYIKQQRPQLLLQLTMEAMASKPTLKTGS